MAKQRWRRAGKLGIGGPLIAVVAVYTLALPASAGPARTNTLEFASGTIAVHGRQPIEFSDVDPCFMEIEVDVRVNSVRELQEDCGPITTDLGFTFTNVGGEVDTAGSYTFSSRTEGWMSLPVWPGAEFDNGCSMGPPVSGTEGPILGIEWPVLEGPFSTKHGVTSVTLSANDLPVGAIQADDDCSQEEADQLNAAMGLPGIADLSSTGTFADFPLR